MNSVSSDHQHDRLPADVDDFAKMGLHAQGGDRRDQAPARGGVAGFADEFGDRHQAVDDDQRRECGDEPGQQRRPLALAMAALRSRPNARSQTITGSSIATRISLTTVAVSPASGEMA